MPDVAEVAIQGALTDRLRALVLVPALTVAFPDTTFTPPSPAPGAKWLEANFLPADSVSIGISDDADNQHYGIFQVSVRGFQGDGDPSLRRVAAAVGAWFRRGTRMTRDGFVVTSYEVPRIAGGSKDDPWWLIPVSISYRCFAPQT
jgi:hypothetical protein